MAKRGAVEDAQPTSTETCKASRTRAARAALASGTSDLEQLGHDLLHHLVGATSDGGEAGIDEGARGGVLPDVPAAAEQLHAGRGDVLLHVRAKHLRHRDVEPDVLARDD